MYLRLNDEHRCYDSYRSPEQWGEWRESWDYDPPSEAYLVTNKSYDTHPYIVPDVVLAPAILYVIYAVWSSGDSFGNADRGSSDIISIHADPERARRNLEILQNANGTVVLEMDDGSTINYYPSWGGYFEHLDTLAIANVMYLGQDLNR